MLTQYSSIFPNSLFGIANSGGGLGGVDFDALIASITVRQLPERVIDALMDACTLSFCHFPQPRGSSLLPPLSPPHPLCPLQCKRPPRPLPNPFNYTKLQHPWLQLCHATVPRHACSTRSTTDARVGEGFKHSK